MANAIFPNGLEGIADDTISLQGDVRAMLVLSTYVYNAANKFVSDLGAVDNGRSVALTTKTFTGGVFNAANTSVTAIAAAASKAIVLYQFNAADTAARLISFQDVGTGLPFTPAAGQNVPVNWSTGVDKIFKL